jgi:hypothetical protein
MIRATFICFLAAFATREAFAADTQPLLATPRKLMFEDDFSQAEMKPNWKVAKGLWVVKDGVLSAEEVPADKHSAYASIDPKIPCKDVVAEFSFKLDGAKNLHLTLRDSNYKGSHVGQIAQAIIFPTRVVLMDMKLGIMKNENFEVVSNLKASAAEKNAIEEKIKDKTVSFKVSFDLSAWHPARVEVAGDEMLLSIDGKPVGYIKSEGIDHATKNTFVFNVGGKSVEIKNVKFWEATPAVGWSDRRAEVLAGLKN